MKKIRIIVKTEFVIISYSSVYFFIWDISPFTYLEKTYIMLYSQEYYRAYWEIFEALLQQGRPEEGDRVPKSCFATLFLSSNRCGQVSGSDMRGCMRKRMTQGIKYGKKRDDEYGYEIFQGF